MKKKLKVLQEGYKECGAACLLSIIRYYKGDISINKLLELTHTNKSGTTFYNLKEASAKIGIDSIGFKVEDKEKLTEIKIPSICQLINDNYEHFVVLYKIDKKYVTIMDPGTGFKKIRIADFYKLWTGYILIFSKSKQLPVISPKKYINKLIVNTININKRIVLNIIFLEIVFTITSCLYTTYTGNIIDKIIDTNKYNLLFITFIFTIVLLIKNISSFFRNELLIYLNQKLDCSIFLGAFNKILLLPYSYYKNKTTGEIITRINDLTYIKNLLCKIILTVFLDISISLICGIILFKINKIMFLLVIITIIIYIFIFLIFRPFLKKYTNINQENNAIINSQMIEMVNGFESIKNLNLESTMNNKMANLYVKSLNDSFIYDNTTNLELFIKELFTSIIVLLITFLGFNLVFNNIMTLGNVITFITLTTYFIEPLTNIIDLNKDYYYAVNSLKRANNLMDIESTDLNTKTKYNITGNIIINNLNYSYNDYKPILTNINLTIKKGEKVLLLGQSGSGKSTILKLLSKYYIPNRDNIYLDNIDINDISITNLKDKIVSISQEELIFNDTIKNNIILNRNIDEEDFINICNLVYVNDITKEMFLGYETILEENGQNISGGQKQRIILARALLKKGNIFLIDEGLNAIDINLERKILKNIFKYYYNKTILIVSHRIENIDLYDKVVRLNAGKIENVLSKPKEIYNA